MFSLFIQVFSSSLMITSSERDKGRDDPVDNRAQKVLRWQKWKVRHHIKIVRLINQCIILKKLKKCHPRSLFQIVNFPNSECVSEAGDAGVCMTSGECLSRSGLVSGSCAQGFGACCLVYHDQCGGTLEYNNTYIRCNNSKHILNNHITTNVGTPSFRKHTRNSHLVNGRSRRHPQTSVSLGFSNFYKTLNSVLILSLKVWFWRDEYSSSRLHNIWEHWTVHNWLLSS